MGIEIWSSATTYGDLYDPAMLVQTKEEADAYFDKLREHFMSYGQPADTVDDFIKTNLGYWAAYGDEERRERIERLYDCAHPYFGPIAVMGRPTTDEILRLGTNRGKGSGPQTLAELRKSTL